MTIRITAACPVDLMADANNLAMVLAHGPADELTYRNPSWQDAAGNLYAVASFDAPPEWVQGAQSALVRPEWDAEPYTISMAAARRAQEAMVFWAGEGSHPAAKVGVLTASAYTPPLDALAAMGLTPVPVEI
jgi:hypothetical protein